RRIDDHPGIEVYRLNFPGAILLDETVFEGALRQLAVASSGTAGHDQFHSARFGTKTIRCNSDERLQVDVIVKLAIAKSLRSELLQAAADARLPDIDASQSQLQRSVFGKKTAHLIP